MNGKININLIESYIGENFLSYSAFCKQCGISLPTLNKIRNGEDVRMTSLFKIAQTLKIGISDLIVTNT